MQKKPISFIDHPESCNVLSGDDLGLHCTISYSGSSTVSLQWRYNNQHIIKTESNLPKKNGNFSSTLHIYNISFHDEGKYECLALDGFLATLSKTAVVHVIGTYVGILV